MGTTTIRHRRKINMETSFGGVNAALKSLHSSSHVLHMQVAGQMAHCDLMGMVFWQTVPHLQSEHDPPISSSL